MIWFDDVPSFPPQAVVGVISGVLNNRNVHAFMATSKSTVCMYVCPYMNVFFKYAPQCAHMCSIILL